MIPQFRYCCNKVLPAVYQDALSEWENICKMVEKLNQVIETTNKTTETVNELQRIVNELNIKIEDFLNHYSNFIDNEAIPIILDTLNKFVKQVFFGLTNDGYFCAYIPDSWDDITFFTESNFNNPDYGRLQLWY